MAVVALITLFLVIFIGTWRKINIGIVGIVGACVLSLVASVSTRELLAGFNTTLFLRLLGIQLLVCVAQANGTMETLAKKLVSVGSKSSIRLIPVIIYVCFPLCGYAGVDIIFLATPFIIALALQLRVQPMKMLFTLILAFQGSAISPLATSGINAYSLAEGANIAVNGWNCAITTGIATTIMFVAVYFIFGWHKEKNREIEGIKDVHFNKNHLLTLLGFVFYVIMTMFMKMDVAVAPTIIAFVLMLIGAADSRKVVSSIPWNVLIIIGGMSMMAQMVATLGGVDLLASVISAVNVPALNAPLLLVVAGTMSFFSSGNGVVMPTLIPIVANLSGNTSAMIAAIGMGAGCTGISPMSTIGGNMMSSYDSIYKPTEEERSKMFNQLMLAALTCMAVNALFGLLGLYNLTIV